MKGDFTRFTHDPRKHYTRVLKQQGRVDLDADWNEAVEIFTRRDRIEAIDVIGRCGVPQDSNGFKIDATPDGSDLTITPGRIYVDGILCEREGPDAGSITEQEDLPGYEPPAEAGVYLAYVDVWDRHITYLEDPGIREVALGGPDTTTRTRTICQVRLLRIADDGPLDRHACQPFPADPSTGRLAAAAASSSAPTNPCAVPEGAGYTGLENRLYRVEIHDDGRGPNGTPGARPVTFKWSRDNGSVVLPVADDNGIDGDRVTLKRFGFDEVLTVKVGDWVEVLGDETELYGRPGTLAQIVPDGIDRADLEVELDRDVSAHAGESYLKLRRWDHQATADLALVDGALPIPAGPFELEDGVIVEFQAGGTYHVGDYWVIPARTREGTVLWPQEGTPPAARLLLPHGIRHHYCTLALVRRSGEAWTEVRDCRPLFPPLTRVGEGCCCVAVEPGEDIQQALDTVVAAGGGCVTLCEGVHVVRGPLWMRHAADVTLTGEAAATVVRFEVADDRGPGGLVIEDGQRIAVTDLFLATDSAPALVTVRHDENLAYNRQIALRRLILLNLAASDRETNLPCGVRLAHTDGVTIEACRIAAESGIVSLWGNTLPDLTGPGGGGDGPEGPAPALLTLGFEALEPGAEFRVGERFTEAGVTVTGEPFQWADGRFTEDGFARVEAGGQAGGSGQELQVNNILLAFDLPAPYATARVTFGAFGGNVNLRVNGELRNAGDFSDLDGELVGGVRVRVTTDPDGTGRGLLSLDADTDDIRDVALGGQELWIDDVVFRGPAQQPPAEPPTLAYGDGVRDLRMRDTSIRFRDLGILAARAERWQLDRADVRPYDDAAWAALRERFGAGGQEDGEGPSARTRHSGVLAALEEVFATPGAPRGYALLAFRWQACAVRHSVLAGRHGLHGWWWLGGGAHGNDVTTVESGAHAFWLYEADWTENAVETTDGLSLSVGGGCRARLEHNRLRGPVGIANLPFADAFDALDTLARALLRGYGTDRDLDTAVLYGLLVDESFELMGLGPLMDALQPIVDAVSPTPGIPPAYYLAPGLVASLREGGGFLRALPVVDLQVVHNDLACRQQGLVLDGFLPLGSLRVADNQIHTVAGQAVRVETNPFFANAHLVVFLVRALLARLLRLVEDARDRTDDGTTAGVLEALVTLIAGWQEGAERLFDLDFRIEGNTIRSLRTAIESNLFELSVLTNHVTMQERATAAPGDTTGRIFGRVMTPQGGAVVQASVRVVGTERVVFTDEKAEYQITGLPPGAYELRATRAGFSVATAEVTLAAGKQVEVNFTISPIVILARSVEGAGFSDAVVGARSVLAAVPNPEIAEIVDALEGSPALEPLAVALREGAHTMPEAYASYLAGTNGPLATPAARGAAADAVTLVQGQTTDPEMRQVAGQLNAALRANDQTGLQALLVRFIRALHRYIDSQGILVKGTGGRIVENQVVVPADVREDTEALGGIQVSVHAAYLAALVSIGAFLMRYLGSADDDRAAPTDPLLGVTDTLIDNNEVVGGVGHGISVQGVAGQPDFVSDLRIRSNQVRGMAGAGLFINEHALVVGLDVAGNHVSACGRSAGFTQHKGGLVVRTAAVCGLHGNHVLRCGDDLRGAGAYGVDLDTLYGLRFTGNEVQANGSESGGADDGGLRLVEVYGATLLHDNVFAFNRGLGLSWVNSAREGEAALLPAFLLQAVNAYLRADRTAEGLVEEEQASVQGNVFKSSTAADFPVFQLLNLRELSFSGNTCHAGTTSAPLGEIQQTTRGVVTGNQTQTNAEVAIAIKKMAGGVVLGNVGNRPIQLQASPGVERAFNVPPAV